MHNFSKEKYTNVIHQQSFRLQPVVSCPQRLIIHTRWALLHVTCTIFFNYFFISPRIQLLCGIVHQISSPLSPMFNGIFYRCCVTPNGTDKQVTCYVISYHLSFTYLQRTSHLLFFFSFGSYAPSVRPNDSFHFSYFPFSSTYARRYAWVHLVTIFLWTPVVGFPTEITSTSRLPSLTIYFFFLSSTCASTKIYKLPSPYLSCITNTSRMPYLVICSFLLTSTRLVLNHTTQHLPFLVNGCPVLYQQSWILT